jgi:L-iditol 2-dehydrogenase
VCGSDIHYFSEGGIGDQRVSYPFRVGHELSATVVEVGPAVECVQAGDRVAVDPAMSCGRCHQCRSGRSHTCTELIFLGCPGQAEGCLSEYIVMPEECCFPVPDSLSPEEAALVEPLSIGMYAEKSAAPIKGAGVGILGCGPIGLCVLLPALAEGAAAVYVTDKIEERLEVARSAGAAWTGNPLRQDIVAEISDHEPELLDLVFECCGQQEALDQAIELLKPGGKLMIIGIPEGNRISFDINEMRRKEIAVQNVRRQNGCMQPAIEFIARGHDVSFMITHHFSLEESQKAFDLVAGYRDGVVKAMIRV